MTHDDAIREMAVERYILGELAGDSRSVFEEHLFDCHLCAADLQSGITLLEGTRRELAADVRKEARPVRRSFLSAWLSPVWMAPTLAACLGFIVFQSAFIVPGMRRELTAARTPAVLSSLVLTGGAARGVDEPTVTASGNGSFLLSVDIPALGDYSSYVCALHSPDGRLVWSGKVSAEQAKDAVQLYIPSAITRPGENTLVVQGLRSDSPDAKMEVLATNKFILQDSK